MNIWVIGRSYPMKSNNMIGSFELEQAKMLAKHGHNVSYITIVFHPFKKINKWGFSFFDDDNVKIYACSIPWTPQRMDIHWKWLQERKWQALLEKVENASGRPDVIHVHYPSMITEPDAVFKYKSKQTKIITTEHWTKVQTKKIGKVQTNNLKKYVESANAFLCVGQPLADSVKEITGSKNNIRVVPNIVNSLFKPNYDNNKPADDEFTFIATGRIVPVKQFDMLIKAFDIAFHDDAKVKLKIAGGGNKKLLLQLIEKLDMKNHINLLGPCSREEIAALTASADCLVCSSRLETFGVPVIEAGACGIPVVTTDAIGFLPNWRDFLGKVVHWDNVNELANAMKYVKENINNYDKKQISEYTNSLYSEDAVYSKLLEIYTED